jgi:isocitrate dehydrogenase
VEVGEKSLSGRQLKRYSIWMETIRRNKIFWKPITTPGGGYKSLNVTTRKWAVFEQLRPCKVCILCKLKHPVMDIVIVRKWRDLYAGIEHQQVEMRWCNV